MSRSWRTRTRWLWSPRTVSGSLWLTPMSSMSSTTPRTLRYVKRWILWDGRRRLSIRCAQWHGRSGTPSRRLSTTSRSSWPAWRTTKMTKWLAMFSNSLFMLFGLFYFCCEFKIPICVLSIFGFCFKCIPMVCSPISVSLLPVFHVIFKFCFFYVYFSSLRTFPPLLLFYYVSMYYYSSKKNVYIQHKLVAVAFRSIQQSPSECISGTVSTAHFSTINTVNKR